MKRLLFVVFFACALSLLHPVPGRATQFIPLTLEELEAQSQVILRASVESKTCLRDPVGRIYTRLEVRVAEVWKGTVKSNSFVIVQAGGVLGEERVTVSGQPEFKIGEEVVAFLVLNPRGEGVILGVAQGKFEVWQDTDTGEKFARNLFHGGPPPATSTDGVARATTRVPANWRLKVSDLKQRIQSTRQ